MSEQDVKQNKTCSCGSGLRHLRCCGLDLFALSPAGASDVLLPLLAQAEAEFSAGREELAADRVRHMLELAPGREEALLLLARICRAQERKTAAEVLLRRVLALNPNQLVATGELTLLLLEKAALAEAEEQARNAVRLAPRNIRAQHLLGLVLTEANWPAPGEYHYRRAIELTAGAGENKDPILFANLAWNLKCQGRMAEAREFYWQSREHGAPALQTFLGFAKLEEADRNFAQAAALLDEAEQAYPGDAQLRMARATVLARQGETQAALSLLAQAPVLGPHELSEKGRLLDRLGCYDEAFAAFDTAKQPVIRVVRHPLDVVLSVYANHLTHGFHCAAALESIARLVAELVAHYRHVLEQRFLLLRYEDFLQDQEGNVRRLLGFLGLEFDENCLKFHENRRYARTASYAQVTEPLYHRSCYRYRHYLPHLEPVIGLLAPVIERLGYHVETQAGD